MLPGIYDAFQHWGKQTVWIYSDPHFGDKHLEAEIKSRPSDEEQIKMINSCVGKKDTLIILGDIGDIECVRKLRAGRKVLIMGNHDSGATNYKRKKVCEMFDANKYTIQEAMADMAKRFLGWKVYAVHCEFGNKWAVYADNLLFDEIYEGTLIIGEKLILSHEPVDIPWLFNIHGHDHGGKKCKGHFNVCSDVISYKPINLNQFLKSGPAANIQSIHRITIDKAIERKWSRK